MYLVDILVTKLLAQLLYPLSLSLWLVLLGVVLSWCRWRRVGHGAIILGLAILWLTSTPVFSASLRGSLERRFPPVHIDQSPVADAIVVLGGIAPALPPRLTPDLSAAADRVLHAARLYQAGKAPLVIASGGAVPWRGVLTPEAQPMAELLHEWGVPWEAILLEMHSLNTYQNALETKRLLDTHRLGTVLLVTSALHMCRALAAFQAVGINAIPVPTDIEVVERDQRTVLDWLPNAGALMGTTRALKEYLGFIVYRLRGWL
jgi:uncharacterized SAM-binding protein YcdF (DUF218 family)